MSGPAAGARCGRRALARAVAPHARVGWVDLAAGVRELHNSAKQRVHGAHLVLSAALGSADDGARRGIEHAVAELRAAASYMDTSVAELRPPSTAGRWARCSAHVSRSSATPRTPRS